MPVLPSRTQTAGLVGLVLPWPGQNVNANHQYLRTRRGVHLTDVARAWRDTVFVLARQHSVHSLPAVGPLLFSLDAYCPDLRRHDLDGLIKATQDAVCAACGVDDSRVTELRARKFVDRTNPRLVVGLASLERED